MIARRLAACDCVVDWSRAVTASAYRVAMHRVGKLGSLGLTGAMGRAVGRRHAVVVCWHNAQGRRSATFFTFSGHE